MEAPSESDASVGDSASLLQELWRARIFVGGVPTAVAIAFSCYAFLAQQWFRAEVVLAPANRNVVSAGLGQFSGIASLAGISLDQGGTTQTPVAVLRSKSLAADFIGRYSLMHVLLAKSWDEASGRWREPDPGKQPDIRDAVKVFDEKVRAVVEDRKTGLISLTITWTDPKLCADWANWLVRDTNQKLRDQAESEAQRNITYLRQQLNEATVPALQQSIGKTLEAEMQKLLLAKGNEEFAFKVIDPAYVPKKSVAPNRLSLIFSSFLMSLVLSVLLVALRKELIKQSH